MDDVIRTVAIYLVLLLLFRITGKRTLDSIDTFDLVVLLVISEATQQALLGEDFSLTGAVVVILTLLTLTTIGSLWKYRSTAFDTVTEGPPLILVAEGKPYRDRMKKERVDLADIIGKAREQHGLERLEQIKYAVLEPSGGMSIIPVGDGAAEKKRVKKRAPDPPEDTEHDG